MSHEDAFTTAIALGGRTLLGLDGSSVDEAADAAFTPTGPPREELLARIAARRAA